MTSPRRTPWRYRALAAALVFHAGAVAQMRATFEQRLQHWAWQPLADPTPPAVAGADAAWVLDPLDALVLARLQQHGLRPAPPLPPAAWLRRVTFDLVGLPPSPAAVLAFEADPSPAARARVVDALLASPAYGERWARHWLDVVRYAESLGHEFDFVIPNAWRYRDYVIRALNADLPFDRFATEQIAGDLLPQPRLDPATGADESTAATAFWWFAEQTHGPIDPEQHRADRIDNMIDVFGKAFLGVTVACARCHDHKFDAIESTDYYALFGFLKASHYVQRPLFPTPPAASARATAAHRELAALAVPGGATAIDASAARDGDAECLPGWQRTGDAFGDAPWTGPFVAAIGDASVHLLQLPGAWWHSAALDRARDGALLSPTLALDRDYLHLEVAGRGARAQVVVDGFHLVRDPLYDGLHKAIDGEAAHWLTFDVHAWRGHEAHVQVLDVRAHDLADPDRDGKQYPDDAWFAVHRLVADDSKEPPPTAAEVGEYELPRGAAAVESAIDAWQQACAALPPPVTVPATIDGTGEDEHVFFRGDHHQRRALAPRRFLRALDGDSALMLPAGSGRLQLAERVFAADDPLPARVFTNRTWHHLFGRGLSRTVDNFGHLGEPPTHGELLDRLARDVVADGWSQKRLIRRIVLSRTYAMDSRGDPAADTADPDNHLLHRHELRRLEGEPLRDAMLVFAARLDARPFGPSVAKPLVPDDDARGSPHVSG